MIRIHRPAGRLLVALVLSSVGMGHFVRAQDVEEPAIDPVLPGLQVTINDRQFDQAIFGPWASPEQHRGRLERILTSRVNTVDRICPLTDLQKKKLMLAGRGDIKRFFDRVDATRKRIQLSPIDQAELHRVVTEIQPLGLDSRPDPFGEKSLFRKSLNHTLTPAQFARYQVVTRDVVVAHHRTTIKWVVGIMDTTLRLSKEQHRRLEELFVKETRPPKRFGEYDYYGVMFQVSRLPETRLRPIFDDVQWGKLSLQLAEAVRLEQTLKDEGFVPDDQVAEAATGRREQPVARPAEPRG
jgi:hypothetical protein